MAAHGAEVTIQLRILRGVNLPKADLMSEIDPYVKFSYKGVVLQTAVVDNTKDPEWNEDFFLDCLEQPDSSLVGAVRLDLWDQEEVGVDLYCGYAVLDLTQYDADHLLSGEELPLRVIYPPEKRAKFQKQGRESTIVVAILGRMPSFKTFVKTTVGLPGMKVVAAQRSLYAEVPSFGGRLLVGICWSYRTVEFKACVMRPNLPTSVDLECVSGASDLGTQCRSQESTLLVRMVHAAGEPGIIPGARVYEEFSTNHLVLTNSFDQVRLTVCDRKKLGTINVGQALADVGWKGPDTSFRSASRSLARRGCMVDKDWRSIYVPVDDKPEPEMLLLLDYSSGDSPSLKLCVMAVEGNDGRSYNFSVPSQGTVLITTERFSEPMAIMEGAQAIARTLELPAPLMGQVLSGTEVVIYELSRPQSWSMADLTNPKRRVEGRRVEPPPSSKQIAVTLSTKATGLNRKFRKVVSRLARLVRLRSSRSKDGAALGSSGRRDGTGPQQLVQGGGDDSHYDDDEDVDEDFESRRRENRREGRVSTSRGEEGKSYGEKGRNARGMSRSGKSGDSLQHTRQRTDDGDDGNDSGGGYEQAKHNGNGNGNGNAHGRPGSSAGQPGAQRAVSTTSRGSSQGASASPTRPASRSSGHSGAPNTRAAARARVNGAGAGDSGPGPDRGSVLPDTGHVPRESSNTKRLGSNSSRDPISPAGGLRQMSGAYGSMSSGGSGLTARAGQPRGTHLNAGAGSIFARKASLRAAPPADDSDDD